MVAARSWEENNGKLVLVEGTEVLFGNIERVLELATQQCKDTATGCMLKMIQVVGLAVYFTTIKK